ncbi:MAG TPA: DUF2878 domain-containing protein [Luteibacter sp.]|uniref:DUF2878 domain-containing protein n=1 Tax=Luteibacter sp. TaxID=1886636 RepID=UPI002BCEDA6B|nr:DUF2878 domain-containing protein [Luteibacter sp.]HVI54897.1 DUF2878 domain-containing protein [Luteibacter sp.]
MIASWSSVIGYQLVWFVAVIFAGRGEPWPGVIAALAFVGWQLGVSARPRAALRIVTIAVLCGVTIDGLVRGWHLADYAAAMPALPTAGAPLWILGLWACFSLTLGGPLRALGTRPVLAVLIGGIGGPLAYAGAASGWAALTFEAPAWRALAVLAAGWAMAMPLLAALSHRWLLVRAPA